MTFLTALFEISVYSAFLFLAILAFRRFFGRHLSPALGFAVWLLLVARLCLPVTLESGFHLFPARESAAATAPLAAPEGLSVREPHPAPSAVNRTDAPPAVPKAYEPTEPAEPGPAFHLTWEDGLLAVWAAGAVLRILSLILAERGLRRTIAQSSLPDARAGRLYARCREEFGVKRDIPLRLIADGASPALTVRFRPMVLLPERLAAEFSDEQLSHILRHELAHYRRGDHLLAMLLRLIEAVYWFNPVVWLMRRPMARDMEAACDSRAAAGFGSGERREYALTLLALFSPPGEKRALLGMALSATEKEAERRVRSLFKPRRSKGYIRAVAALFAAVLFLTCFTTACRPAPAPSAEPVGGTAFLEKGAAATPAPSAEPEPEVQESAPAPAPVPENRWMDTLTVAGFACPVDASIEYGSLPFGAEEAAAYRVEQDLLTEDRLREFSDYFSIGFDVKQELPFVGVIRTPAGENLSAFIRRDVFSFGPEGGILQPERYVLYGDAYPGEEPHALENVRISTADARAVAERALADLGIEGQTLVTAEKARILMEDYRTAAEGWRLVYRLNMGLTPFGNMDAFNIHDVLQFSPAELYAPWPREQRIEFFVSENGIEMFEYAGGLRVISAHSAALMPLSDVKARVAACFAEGLQGVPLHAGDTPEIQRLVLSHVLVKTDEEGMGELHPAWVVYFETAETRLANGMPVIVCFSAVDGRRIDPHVADIKEDLSWTVITGIHEVQDGKA